MLLPPPLPLPLQGDALDPQEAWRGVLKGAAGVVSTLGAFGSNEHMYKVLGLAPLSSLVTFRFGSDTVAGTEWHDEGVLVAALLLA